MLNFLNIIYNLFLLPIVIFGQTYNITKDIDQILRLHNMFRKVQRASDMNKLTWSDALSKKAQTFVDKCILQPVAGATPWIGDTNPNKYAEEIIVVPEATLVSTAIETWYSEKFSWIQGQVDCHDSCSFTQMVWANSTEVGCAVKRCAALSGAEEIMPNAWFMACHYNPPAKQQGTPYKTGRACELCNQATTVCEDGLCALRAIPPPPPNPPPNRPPQQGLNTQHRQVLSKLRDMINGALTIAPLAAFGLGQQAAANPFSTHQWQRTAPAPNVNNRVSTNNNISPTRAPSSGIQPTFKTFSNWFGPNKKNNPQQNSVATTNTQTNLDPIQQQQQVQLLQWRQFAKTSTHNWLIPKIENSGIPIQPQNTSSQTVPTISTNLRPNHLNELSLDNVLHATNSFNRPNKLNTWSDIGMLLHSNPSTGSNNDGSNDPKWTRSSSSQHQFQGNQNSNFASSPNQFHRNNVGNNQQWTRPSSTQNKIQGIPSGGKKPQWTRSVNRAQTAPSQSQFQSNNNLHNSNRQAKSNTNNQQQNQQRLNPRQNGFQNQARQQGIQFGTDNLSRNANSLNNIQSSQGQTTNAQDRNALAFNKLFSSSNKNVNMLEKGHVPSDTKFPLKKTATNSRSNVNAGLVNGSPFNHLQQKQDSKPNLRQGRKPTSMVISAKRKVFSARNPSGGMLRFQFKPGHQGTANTTILPTGQPNFPRPRTNQKFLSVGQRQQGAQNKKQPLNTSQNNQFQRRGPPSARSAPSITVNSRMKSSQAHSKESMNTNQNNNFQQRGSPSARSAPSVTNNSRMKSTQAQNKNFMNTNQNNQFQQRGPPSARSAPSVTNNSRMKSSQAQNKESMNTNQNNQFQQKGPPSARSAPSVTINSRMKNSQAQNQQSQLRNQQTPTKFEQQGVKVNDDQPYVYVHEETPTGVVNLNNPAPRNGFVSGQQNVNLGASGTNQNKIQRHQNGQQILNSFGTKPPQNTNNVPNFHVANRGQNAQFLTAQQNFQSGPQATDQVPKKAISQNHQRQPVPAAQQQFSNNQLNSQQQSNQPSSRFDRHPMANPHSTTSISAEQSHQMRNQPQPNPNQRRFQNQPMNSMSGGQMQNIGQPAGNSQPFNRPQQHNSQNFGQTGPLNGNSNSRAGSNQFENNKSTQSKQQINGHNRMYQVLSTQQGQQHQSNQVPVGIHPGQQINKFNQVSRNSLGDQQNPQQHQFNQVPNSSQQVQQNGLAGQLSQQGMSISQQVQQNGVSNQFNQGISSSQQVQQNLIQNRFNQASSNSQEVQQNGIQNQFNQVSNNPQTVQQNEIQKQFHQASENPSAQMQPTGSCVDNNKHCSAWASYCKDGSNAYVLENCLLTCNLCQTPQSLLTPQSQHRPNSGTNNGFNSNQGSTADQVGRIGPQSGMATGAQTIQTTTSPSTFQSSQQFGQQSNNGIQFSQQDDFNVQTSSNWNSQNNQFRQAASSNVGTQQRWHNNQQVEQKGQIQPKFNNNIQFGQKAPSNGHAQPSWNRNNQPSGQASSFQRGNGVHSNINQQNVAVQGTTSRPFLISTPYQNQQRSFMNTNSINSHPVDFNNNQGNQNVAFTTVTNRNPPSHSSFTRSAWNPTVQDANQNVAFNTATNQNLPSHMSFTSSAWNPTVQESVPKDDRLFQIGQISMNSNQGSANGVSSASHAASVGDPINQQTGTGTASPNNANCKDRNDQCRQWKSFCNTDYVGNSCLKSCNRC